jgi:hypothetical protein
MESTLTSPMSDQPDESQILYHGLAPLPVPSSPTMVNWVEESNIVVPPSIYLGEPMVSVVVGGVLSRYNSDTAL